MTGSFIFVFNQPNIVFVVMAKLISKQDIFKAGAIQVESFTVEAWGGEVRFKPMTMLERRQARQKSMVAKLEGDGEEVDAEALEIWAVIMCALAPDSDTRSMFTPDDYAQLEGQMQAGGLSQLAQAILKSSGMLDADFRKVEKADKK